MISLRSCSLWVAESGRMSCPPGSETTDLATKVSRLLVDGASPRGWQCLEKRKVCLGGRGRTWDRVQGGASLSLPHVSEGCPLLSGTGASEKPTPLKWGREFACPPPLWLSH